MYVARVCSHEWIDGETTSSLSAHAIIIMIIVVVRVGVVIMNEVLLLGGCTLKVELDGGGAFTSLASGSHYDCRLQQHSMLDFPAEAMRVY